MFELGLFLVFGVVYESYTGYDLAKIVFKRLKVWDNHKRWLSLYWNHFLL